MESIKHFRNTKKNILEPHVAILTVRYFKLNIFAVVFMFIPSDQSFIYFLMCVIITVPSHIYIEIATRLAHNFFLYEILSSH